MSSFVQIQVLDLLSCTAQTSKVYIRFITSQGARLDVSLHPFLIQDTRRHELMFRETKLQEIDVEELVDALERFSKSMFNSTTMKVYYCGAIPEAWKQRLGIQSEKGQLNFDVIRKRELSHTYPLNSVAREDYYFFLEQQGFHPHDYREESVNPCVAGKCQIFLSDVRQPYSRFQEVKVPEKGSLWFGVLPHPPTKVRLLLKTSRAPEIDDRTIELLGVFATRPSDLPTVLREGLRLIGNERPILYVYPFWDYPDEEADFAFTFAKERQLTSFSIYQILRQEFKFLNVGSSRRQGVAYGSPPFHSSSSAPSSSKSIPPSFFSRVEKVKLHLQERFFPFHVASIEKVLGEGSYGCTVLVQLDEDNSKPRAVVKVMLPTSESQLDSVLHEMDVLDLLSAYELPHIPKFYGATTAARLENVLPAKVNMLEELCPKQVSRWENKKPDDMFYFLGMSVISGEDLFDATSRRSFDVREIRSILFQLLYCLAFYERVLGFVHYDLSENNIMLTPLQEDKKQARQKRTTRRGKGKGKAQWRKKEDKSSSQGETLWSYQWMDGTLSPTDGGIQEWLVPMYSIVNLIDFGGSFTHKSLRQVWGRGTSGFRHPISFFAQGTYVTWTLDWYACGKHLWNLALAPHATFDDLASSWLKADSQWSNFVKTVPGADEEREDALEGMVQILLLQLLGHPFPQTWLKTHNLVPVGYRLANEVQLINAIYLRFTKGLHNAKKHFIAKMGVSAWELLQVLCQWRYKEMDARTALLSHSFFQPFLYQNHVVGAGTPVRVVRYSL